MLTTIYIVGMPGAGKSTLVRRLLLTFGDPGHPIKYRATDSGKRLNTVTITPYPSQRILLLGLYDDSPYAGTDRYGLNVVPVACNAVTCLANEPMFDNWLILGEGDRLGTPSFLNRCEQYGPVRLAHLVVDDATLAARRLQRQEADIAFANAHPMFHGKPRRADRASTGQNASWLKGRATKIERLTKAFTTTRFDYVAEPQTERVFELVSKALDFSRRAGYTSRTA